MKNAICMLIFGNELYVVGACLSAYVHKKFIEKNTVSSYTVEYCKGILKQEFLTKINCQNKEEYQEREKNIDRYIDNLVSLSDEKFIEKIEEFDLELGLRSMSAIMDNRISILFDIPEISFYNDTKNDIMNNFNTMIGNLDKFFKCFEGRFTDAEEKMQLRCKELHHLLKIKIENCAFDTQAQAHQFLQSTREEVLTVIKQSNYLIKQIYDIREEQRLLTIEDLLNEIKCAQK